MASRQGDIDDVALGRAGRFPVTRVFGHLEQWLAHNGPMLDIAELHQRAMGVRVSKILPCEEDYIVLFDYYEASRASLWENLLRSGPDGHVVWAASTPTYRDMFTGVEWREGRLIAWTWECFMITVDPKTGMFIEKVFTK